MTSFVQRIQLKTLSYTRCSFLCKQRGIVPWDTKSLLIPQITSFSRQQNPAAIEIKVYQVSFSYIYILELRICPLTNDRCLYLWKAAAFSQSLSSPSPSALLTLKIALWSRFLDAERFIKLVTTSLGFMWKWWSNSSITLEGVIRYKIAGDS